MLTTAVPAQKWPLTKNTVLNVDGGDLALRFQVVPGGTVTNFFYINGAHEFAWVQRSYDGSFVHKPPFPGRKVLVGAPPHRDVFRSVRSGPNIGTAFIAKSGNPYLARVDCAGRVSFFNLRDVTAFRARAVDIVPDGTGGFFVAFSDTTSSERGVYLQRIQGNGVRAWANPLKLTSHDSVVCRLACLNDGDVAIRYADTTPQPRVTIVDRARNQKGSWSVDPSTVVASTDDGVAYLFSLAWKSGKAGFETRTLAKSSTGGYGLSTSATWVAGKFKGELQRMLAVPFGSSMFLFYKQKVDATQSGICFVRFDKLLPVWHTYRAVTSPKTSYHYFDCHRQGDKLRLAWIDHLAYKGTHVQEIDVANQTSSWWGSISTKFLYEPQIRPLTGNVGECRSVVAGLDTNGVSFLGTLSGDAIGNGGVRKLNPCPMAFTAVNCPGAANRLALATAGKLPARVMQIYGPSALDLGPSKRIRSIRLRPATSSAAMPAHTVNTRIYLGSGGPIPDRASRTSFAANRTKDRTLVFDGAIRYPAVPKGTGSKVTITVPLQRPFTYTAGKSLVVEWEVSSPTGKQASWSWYNESETYNYTTGATFATAGQACPPDSYTGGSAWNAYPGGTMSWWFYSRSGVSKPALAFLGTQIQQVDMGSIWKGCWLHTNMLFVLGGVTDVTGTLGRVRFDVPVPDGSQYTRMPVYVQSAVLDGPTLRASKRGDFMIGARPPLPALRLLSVKLPLTDKPDYAYRSGLVLKFD